MQIVNEERVNRQCVPAAHAATTIAEISDVVCP